MKNKIKKSPAQEYYAQSYLKKMREEAEEFLLENYKEFFLVTDSRIPYHNITVLSMEQMWETGKHWTNLPCLMSSFLVPNKELLSGFKYNNPRYILGNDVYRYIIDDLENDKTFTLLEADKIVEESLLKSKNLNYVLRDKQGRMLAEDGNLTMILALAKIYNKPGNIKIPRGFDFWLIE